MSDRRHAGIVADGARRLVAGQDAARERDETEPRRPFWRRVVAGLVGLFVRRRRDEEPSDQALFFSTPRR